MGNIETFVTPIEKDEVQDEIVSSTRILRIGLRNNDQEIIDQALKRIKITFGEDLMESLYLRAVNDLLETEDWNFDTGTQKESTVI